MIMYPLALLNVGLILMMYAGLTAAATVVFNCTRIPGTFFTLRSCYLILDQYYQRHATTWCECNYTNLPDNNDSDVDCSALQVTDWSISPCTTIPTQAIKLHEGRLQVAQKLIAATQILLHILDALREWYLSSLVPWYWIRRRSCDEYPFASTHGTGTGGWYSNTGATTRCVSLAECQSKPTPHMLLLQ